MLASSSSPNSFSDEHRLKVMSKAKHVLFHHDVSRHDLELKLGVSRALQRMIQFLLLSLISINNDEVPVVHQQNINISPIVLIILGDVCECLKYVHLCSGNAALKFFEDNNDNDKFQQQGAYDIVNLLLKCIVLSLQLLRDSDKNNHHKDIHSMKTLSNNMLKNSLSALVNIMYLPSIKARMEIKGLPVDFSFFDTIMASFYSQRCDGLKGLKWSLQNTLSLFTTSFYNSIIDVRGGVDLTMDDRFEYLKILISCSTHESTKIRRLVANGIWQLSTHDNNRSHLAQNYFLREALLALVRDKNNETRAFAASTIWQLTVPNECATEISNSLIDHKNGSFIQVLIDLTYSDIEPIDHIRKYAMLSLKALVTPSTVEKIVRHDGLLDRLESLSVDSTSNDKAMQEDAVIIMKRIIASLMLVKVKCN